MSTIKTGGGAFPVQGGLGLQKSQGMTLRDYFAAKALQGMLVHDDANQDVDKAASWAYQFADAMIQEREKEEKP